MRNTKVSRRGVVCSLGTVPKDSRFSIHCVVRIQDFLSIGYYKYLDLSFIIYHILPQAHKLTLDLGL